MFYTSDIVGNREYTERLWDRTPHGDIAIGVMIDVDGEEYIGWGSQQMFGLKDDNCLDGCLLCSDDPRTAELFWNSRLRTWRMNLRNYEVSWDPTIVF